MQATLHQHTSSAELDGFTNLFVNCVEVKDVSLFRLWPFQRAVKRAERAVLGAEIRVINVAVNDVGDHAFGMKLAADGIGFHSDTDEVVRLIKFKRLGVGKHSRLL